MAEASLPAEETIQTMSMDEHEISFNDEEESGTDDELPLTRPCSKALDSIASKLSDDGAAMQEHASAVEKSQLYAELRDSSVGLILKQNHSKALRRLESMKPLPRDRIDVLFLMAECELRLKREEKKYLHELTYELLKTESVDCDDLLEWGNNLALPMNRLVGWIHLYDIARKKMAIKYPNQDKYAAWIVSPAHEIGLKVFDVLKYVKPFDNMLSVAIRNMMEAWVTSLRYVGDGKLKHMSEIQCRVSSALCDSVGMGEIGGHGLYAHHHDLTSNYKDASLHKVLSFVLIAMAKLKIFKGPHVLDLGAATEHCQEGIKACKEALDFISPAEKNAIMLRLEELQVAATKNWRQ